MFCVDSNILIRCITQDDKTQSPKALAFLKRAMAGEGIYVPDVIVLECVWVLQKLYKFAPSDISAAFAPLLVDPKVTFDHADRLQHALTLFASQALSITDAYLAAAVAGSSNFTLATFDKKLKEFSVRSINL